MSVIEIALLSILNSNGLCCCSVVAAVVRYSPCTHNGTATFYHGVASLGVDDRKRIIAVVGSCYCRRSRNSRTLNRCISRYSNQNGILSILNSNGLCCCSVVAAVVRYSPCTHNGTATFYHGVASLGVDDRKRIIAVVGSCYCRRSRNSRTLNRCISRYSNQNGILSILNSNGLCCCSVVAAVVRYSPCTHNGTATFYHGVASLGVDDRKRIIAVVGSCYCRRSRNSRTLNRWLFWFIRRPGISTLFPYTTLCRSSVVAAVVRYSPCTHNGTA